MYSVRVSTIIVMVRKNVYVREHILKKISAPGYLDIFRLKQPPPDMKKMAILPTLPRAPAAPKVPKSPPFPPNCQGNGMQPKRVEVIVLRWTLLVYSFNRLGV